MPPNNDEVRMPPFSQAAERSVIGSCIRDNNVIADVVRYVTVDDFYFDANQKIFRAIVSMFQEAISIDLVTLADKLKQSGHLADVGNYAYLAELWDAAPTAANAEFYSRIVKSKSVNRKLIHASTEIIRDAYDEIMPSEEMLGSAERKILEIAQMGVTAETVRLSETLTTVYDLIDARVETARNSSAIFSSGIMTGYADLDTLLVGLRNSELTLIAARPSVGKTCLCLNIIRNVIVQQRLPVLMISLEQAKIELGERMIVSQAQVDSHRLRKGMLGSDEIQRLMDAGETLRLGDMYIDDTASQNMLRISATARRMKLRCGIKAIFIDYLQLIEPDDKRSPRHEQVSHISRRLKFLARELDLPVIALAQLNRSSEDRQGHKPRLSDLRESGSLEQDADTVILLHRPELYEGGEEKMGVIEIHVAKQRNGPTGEAQLTYVKQFMRFENYAPVD